MYKRIILEKIGKISGIYGIRNIITNQIYIGKAKDIKYRIRRHFNILRLNTEKAILKGENDRLVYSWKKYGEKSFEILLIESCNENELFDKEIYWNAYFGYPDKDKVFNHTPGGIGGYGFTGKHHTEESRNKISESNKGNYLSKEHKEKCSIAKKRYFKENPDAKDKIAESNRTRLITDETKSKMSEKQINRFKEQRDKQIPLILEILDYIEKKDGANLELAKIFNVNANLISSLRNKRHWIFKINERR